MSLVGAITAFGICSNAHKWCLPLPLENCGGVLHLLNGTGFLIAFIWPAFINYKLLSPLIGVVASRIHGVILFVWRLVWPKESALKPSMRDVMQPGGMMSMTWHRKEWKYVTSSSPFISQWRWGERRSQLMWRNHEKKKQLVELRGIFTSDLTWISVRHCQRVPFHPPISLRVKRLLFTTNTSLVIEKYIGLHWKGNVQMHALSARQVWTPWQQRRSLTNKFKSVSVRNGFMYGYFHSVSRQKKRKS